MLRDGLIECLGRLDEQVKVRGHRIEIQEVHDLTIAVAGVAQAAVAVRKVGLGGLEIFVVADPDADGGAPGGNGTAAATWSAASSSTSAPICRPPRCPSASGSSPASSSMPTASGMPTPPGPR